jgi:hypothetical protein
MYGTEPSNHLKAENLAAGVREGVEEQAREQHDAALRREGKKPRGRRWWRFWRR